MRYTTISASDFHKEAGYFGCYILGDGQRVLPRLGPLDKEKADAIAEEFNAMQRPKWISVKDRLPKELSMSPQDCHHVLVWAWDREKNEAVKIKAYHVDDPKWRKDYLWSHWMYYCAPEAPQEPTQ